MTGTIPPLWLDIVGDLAAHIEMANCERPPELLALVEILTRAIDEILRLQSDAALGQVQEHLIEDELANALHREQSRRHLTSATKN